MKPPTGKYGSCAAPLASAGFGGGTVCPELRSHVWTMLGIVGEAPGATLESAYLIYQRQSMVPVATRKRKRAGSGPGCDVEFQDPHELPSIGQLLQHTLRAQHGCCLYSEGGRGSSRAAKGTSEDTGCLHSAGEGPQPIVGPPADAPSAGDFVMAKGCKCKGGGDDGNLCTINCGCKPGCTFMCPCNGGCCGNPVPYSTWQTPSPCAPAPPMDVEGGGDEF